MGTNKDYGNVVLEWMDTVRKGPLVDTQWKHNQTLWQLVHHIPQMLNWIEILVIWRPEQHLELFIMFLKPFLNNVCSVAGCILLLKEKSKRGQNWEVKGSFKSNFLTHLTKLNKLEWWQGFPDGNQEGKVILLKKGSSWAYMSKSGVKRSHSVLKYLD